MKTSHFAILSMLLVSMASTAASPLEVRAPKTVTKTKTKTVTKTRAPVTTTKTKTKTLISTVTAACSANPSSSPSNPSTNPSCNLRGSDSQVRTSYLEPQLGVDDDVSYYNCYLRSQDTRSFADAQSFAWNSVENKCALMNGSLSKMGIDSSSTGDWIFNDKRCNPDFSPKNFKAGTEEPSDYQPQCMREVSDITLDSVIYNLHDKDMTIEKCQKSCQTGISGNQSLQYKCQSFFFTTNTDGQDQNSYNNCKLFFDSAVEVLTKHYSGGEGAYVSDVNCDVTSNPIPWGSP